MKKLEKQELLFIILTAVLFVIGRLGVLIWPEYNGILVAGKILISIEIILFAVLFYLQNKTTFGIYIMITVILYSLADALINIFFPAAMANPDQRGISYNHLSWADHFQSACSKRPCCTDRVLHAPAVCCNAVLL